MIVKKNINVPGLTIPTTIDSTKCNLKFANTWAVNWTLSKMVSQDLYFLKNLTSQMCVMICCKYSQ